MANSAAQLVELFELWNDVGDTRSKNLRAAREAQAQALGRTMIGDIETAMSLYGGCLRQIEEMRLAGVDVSSFELGRKAWVNAIVLPDIQWNSAPSGFERAIDPTSLALLKSLASLYDTFSRPGASAYEVRVDAALSFCDSVEELIEDDELPPVLRQWIRTALDGFRAALDGRDVGSVMRSLATLLAALRLAESAEPGKSWAKKAGALAAELGKGVLANSFVAGAQYGAVALGLITAG